MMYWDGNGTWHPWMAALMWLGMILFWAIVVFGVVWFVRSSGVSRQGPEAPDPERILQERLARGEIDGEEFQRRRDLIRSSR